MVQQLMGDGGKSVKYDQINIPGRTPRALKEHYAQMKNEVQAVDIQNQGSAGIPQVRATRGPGSGKKIKAEGKGTAKAATPSKRKSGDDGNNMSEFFLSFDMQQLTIFPHWIILLQISVASLQLRSSSLRRSQRLRISRTCQFFMTAVPTMLHRLHLNHTTAMTTTTR